nr:uncharacterized protein LOC109190596 [Ipomoea batatas]
MDTGTSSKQGAGLEGDEVHEVDCELSEELFRSLEHSEESAGEVTGIDNVFQQTNLNKEGFKFEIGMIFKSAEEFKWAVKCHEATRRKDIHFKKNEGRRVAGMEEIVAGMEQVVAEEVQVEGQFEDIATETQVPSFVLDEMAIMNSQSSQAVQNQAPPLSEFISAQLPTEILHDIFTGATSPHQQRTSGNHCVDPIELEDIVDPIELEAASCLILASTQGLELDCTAAAG